MWPRPACLLARGRCARAGGRAGSGPPETGPLTRKRGRGGSTSPWLAAGELSRHAARGRIQTRSAPASGIAGRALPAHLPAAARTNPMRHSTPATTNAARRLPPKLSDEPEQQPADALGDVEEQRERTHRLAPLRPRARRRSPTATATDTSARRRGRRPRSTRTARPWSPTAPSARTPGLAGRAPPRRPGCRRAGPADGLRRCAPPRTSTEYRRNTSPEPDSPRSWAYRGMNAVNAASPAVASSRITPGPTAAGWNTRRIHAARRLGRRAHRRRPASPAPGRAWLTAAGTNRPSAGGEPGRSLRPRARPR